MDKFCHSCNKILKIQIDQSRNQLVCDICHTQTDNPDIIYMSSRDDARYVESQSDIYNNPLAQRINQKCDQCQEYYYIYIAGGNEDVRYICKCSVPVYEVYEKKEGQYQPKYKYQHTDQTRNYYDFLQLLKK